MKKAVCAILAGIIAAALLSLSGCSASPEKLLSDGRYVAPTNTLLTLDLDLKEQRFIFEYDSVMSYIPSGSFEVKGRNLTATYRHDSPGGEVEEVYVFEIVDKNNLKFVKDSSSDISLEDGMLFSYSSESKSFFDNME